MLKRENFYIYFLIYSSANRPSSEVLSDIIIISLIFSALQDDRVKVGVFSVVEEASVM